MRFTLISDVHVDSNKWDWNLVQDCDPTIPMVTCQVCGKTTSKTNIIRWHKKCGPQD